MAILPPMSERILNSSMQKPQLQGIAQNPQIQPVIEQQPIMGGIQSATNPETGEKVYFVNGRWTQAQSATNQETGQRAIFVDNEWVNLDSSTSADQSKQGQRAFKIKPEGGAVETVPTQDTERFGVDDNTEWTTVFKESITNIPDSSKEFAADIFNTIFHPIETAKAVGGLAMGAAQKAIPGEQEQEQNVDLLVDFLKDRYGSVQNLKRTIAKDPVGVFADAASFTLPGGSALKTAGGVSKLDKLSKLGSTVQKVGQAVDPISAVSKGVGQTAKFLPKELPSKMYQSAAKFSTTIPENVRKKLTRTALDNEITPTLVGLDKLRGKINVTNKIISDKIDSATQAGNKIPVTDLFKDFNDLLKEANLSGEPITNNRTIKRIRAEIMETNKRLGKDTLTPAEAQKLKQNIYKETESFYSKASQSPIKVRAKQSVARAAKESLEEIFPEIKHLNKSEGEMIALSKEIEKSASRISNRDLLGIGVPIKGGAGGAIGGVPGLLGGIGIGLLDTPRVKAKLAIVLDKLKRKGVEISPESAAFQLGLLAPERIKDEEGDN